MLILQGVAYAHPNKDILFDKLDLTVNRQDKIALTGNNGSGKSTLLKIMAGELTATSGIVTTVSKPYYVPQIFGQFDHYTVAQAMGVAGKLYALNDILAGNVTEVNMSVLDDDWSIEEKCKEALLQWELGDLQLSQKLGTLSGGQKTKAFLAGIMVQAPKIVLLDEPSNHLDAASRSLLYKYIQETTSTLVVVSHDRTLLRLLNTVWELSKGSVTAYGGNYDLYKEQKTIAINAMSEDLRSKEKALRKAKEVERASIERQQKLDARGRKKQEKAGAPTISLNTLRNNAEKSTSRMRDVHTEKTGLMSEEIADLRKNLADKDKIKIGFDNTELHKGKILVTAKGIIIGYGNGLTQHPLSFQIVSGERLAIKGSNGSGKTTLIKTIMNHLQPLAGSIDRADVKMIYIDQDYSLIDNNISVYEQVQLFNTANIEEHEVKSRLTHFLFTKEHWEKPCAALSGGEKMRLVLCCLTLSADAADIIILDEPTNNLDIQNTEILTNAINEYKGTVIAISHDAYFLQQIGIQRDIEL